MCVGRWVRSTEDVKKRFAEDGGAGALAAEIGASAEIAALAEA
jgi:hypothetical protein